MKTKKSLKDIKFCKQILHFHGHNGVDMKSKDCIKMFVDILKDRLNGIEKSNYEIKVFSFDNIDFNWLKSDFKKLIVLLKYQDSI